MKGKYLLLGSNMGDRQKVLNEAKISIEAKAGIITAHSSLYETQAWGYEDQPDFLNQVIKIDTRLNPEQLLSAIARIEKDLGRERYERWHERKIDIDILFYDDDVIKLKHLHVPHPEIPNRRFTLVPLAELCASEAHPVLNKTIKELLADCKDQLPVKKIA